MHPVLTSSLAKDTKEGSCLKCVGAKPLSNPGGGAIPPLLVWLLWCLLHLCLGVWMALFWLVPWNGVNGCCRVGQAAPGGWAFLSACLPSSRRIGGWALLSSDLRMSSLPSRALNHLIVGLCRWENAAAVTSYIYSFRIESLSTPALMWHEAELLTSAFC